MKHNKLRRANAGRTNRLARLVTQEECAFVDNNGFIHANLATPSLPNTGISGFAQLLVGKSQFCFGHTGQLPPLTWYIQR